MIKKLFYRLLALFKRWSFARWAQKVWCKMSILGSSKYGLAGYGASDVPWYAQAGKVAWIVQVDWDNDGTWGAEIESQDIRSIHFKRGREGRMRGDGNGQNHPDGESFDIEIRDSAGKYDVFNASSEIYDRMGRPGLLLRILVVDTTTQAQAEPVFVGTLTGIDWDADMGWGKLSGSGLSRYLELGTASALFSPSLYYNDTFDYITPGVDPMPVNYWKGQPGGLGFPRCLEIMLDLVNFPFDLVTSDVTYSLEPDFLLIDGQTAWEHIAEVVDSFAGRIFFLRDGRVLGIDSQDIVGTGVTTPPVAALRKIGLTKTRPFDSLFNKISIKVRNHAVAIAQSSPPSANLADYKTVWNNSGPIAVAANSNLDIEVEHKTGIGVPTIASIKRLNTADIEIWSNEDRSGMDLGYLGTGECSITILNDNAPGPLYTLFTNKGGRQNFNTIRLANNSSDVAYFFDIELLAVGITETGIRLNVDVEDEESATVNGERVMLINNRHIQNLDTAENVANAYLNACSTREKASVSWLGYYAGGNGIAEFLTGYDLGAVVNFGAQGGGTALANYGVYGNRLIVGQEVEWMDTSGQNAIVRLCFEKMPVPALAVNGVSTGVVSNNSTLSFSHEVVSGDNQVLFVALAKRGWTEASNVTYGGVSMTLAGAIAGGVGDYPRTELWYLENPTVGTANVVATNPTGEWWEGTAITICNADTSDPIRSVDTIWSADGDGLYSAAKTRGDMLLVAGSFEQTTAPECTDGIELSNLTSDGNWRGAVAVDPSGPTASVQWNTPTGGYAYVAAMIKPNEVD